MIEARRSHWEVPTPEDADFVARVHAEIDAAHERVNATLPASAPRMSRLEPTLPPPPPPLAPSPPAGAVPDMPLEQRRLYVRDRLRAGLSVVEVAHELGTYPQAVYNDAYWWCKHYEIEGGLTELWRFLREPVAA